MGFEFLINCSGKKKKKSGGEEKKENGGNTKNNNIIVVLKTDLHCEGCATKVLKCIRSVDGVETASVDEGQKIRVVGKVDPVKLREKVERKTHKKVELISPQPKKGELNGENNHNNNKENAKGKGNDNNKQKQQQQEDKKKESKEKNSKDGETKSGDKKNKGKEPPVTTAVFKVHLHCEGCIQKIHKTVTKTKGYEEMKIDKQKEMVTVTGAIDMKALAEKLKKTLKKEVEIVPLKKKEEKKEDKKEEKKEDKKKDTDGGGEEKTEGNTKTQQSQVGYPYPNPAFYGSGFGGDQFHYNPYPVAPYHAPQIFSDENPNACSVM